MGYAGDYFKTWNWETGFRYSRNEGQDLSIGEVSKPGLRAALLDTDPTTAFNPFFGFGARTHRGPGKGFMLPCITPVSMNCPFTMPRLTVTCSISPPAQSRLRLVASTTRPDSTVIGMR